jgi:hypothetical protein
MNTKGLSSINTGDYSSFFCVRDLSGALPIFHREAGTEARPAGARPNKTCYDGIYCCGNLVLKTPWHDQRVSQLTQLNKQKIKFHFSCRIRSYKNLKFTCFGNKIQFRIIKF